MPKNNQSQVLTITAASENNLKDLNLDIPHDCFTVITGRSGSGKSSLAFDTVYAEGQRRYIETFSPYTRQFFDKVKKPSVGKLDNVRPAIAIQQRNKITGSRSTVGSLTNINDYLKVVWTALSVPYCPQTNEKLIAWDPSLVCDDLTNKFNTQKLDTAIIAAKYKLNIKFKEAEIDRLKTLGFSRIWDIKSNSTLMLEDFDIKNISSKNPEVIVVLDRIKSATKISKTTKRSIESAFSLTNGEVLVIFESNNNFSQQVYHRDFRNPLTGQIIPKPKAYFFSYNHPMGACESCKGFGAILEISKQKVIPDISKTLQEHAISCWSGPSAEWEFNSLIKFCEKNKIPTNIPWSKLKEEQKNKLFTHKDKDFWGVDHWFKWLEKKTYKMHVRVFLSRYREQVTCPECNGSRLKQSAFSYRIDGKSIDSVFSSSIKDNLDWFKSVHNQCTKNNPAIFKSIKDPLNNIIARLEYLDNLGLSYLTLDRPAKTLSGGETQRVNLTTALGSDLVSTQFVLDEPSVGLHPHDSEKLLSAMKLLSSKGNSLLVVEHDPDVITSAEHIIELGPESGKNGGQIIFNDPAHKWPGITIKSKTRTVLQTSKKDSAIKIDGATARNLKDLSVQIPLGRLVCLTGVSGSGKSTLASEVLYSGWLEFKGQKEKSFNFKSISGFESLNDIVIVDQSSLSKTPRATIGTYTKIWDAVRDLLTGTETSLLRGYTKSTFSFNVAGGRCPACEGAGFIKEDMQFLSDVLVPCDSCQGSRFQASVLDVKYNEKSIQDFLLMTVDEALDFFIQFSSSITEPLKILQSLGLGSCTLGHPLSELSGGEAQRLKLVPYLQTKQNTKSLFIFDEPTTGLHVKDVDNLISVFDGLIKDGHSVLCIEHNLSVIQNSDWIIDLGPEGGAKGGHLIYCGESQILTKNKNSLTAQYLSDYISKCDKPWKASKNSKNYLTTKPSAKDLVISGAKEHNLKDVTVTVPSDKIVALTGVSGSGKSTLAKDIIYAEGQRRYLDCLSPYARQFIKELSKPDLDHIENVRPTICVYQHTFQPSELSTIATMSEVYNFLRLLLAKTGTQYCPDHPNEPIKPLVATEITDQILKIPTTTVRILAPVIRSKKGNHREVIQKALQMEISEIRVDGVIAKPSYFLDEPLAKTKTHTIEYVIAKFNPKSVNKKSVEETVEQCLTIGGGSVLTLLPDGTESLYSSTRACPICQRGFLKPDPEDLSFNSKRGRCDCCQGTGVDGDKICASCLGSRLLPIGRNIRIQNKNIFELCKLTPTKLLEVLNKFEDEIEVNAYFRKVSAPVLLELNAKLKTLCELGLDYLDLSRSCRTLSGGELQRLRLASVMGTELSGVCYIFDEPSAGLHPIDNLKVLDRLKNLKQNGNSIILIEHDIDSILWAEHIIDIGPHAGLDGGHIVYAGASNKYIGADSPTGQALIQKSVFNSNIINIKDKNSNKLSIKNGSRYVINNLEVDIPLNKLVTIGGVSGSGKSTLINGILVDTLLNGKKKSDSLVGQFGTVTTTVPVDKIIYIDQKPIGSTSRSTPASYLGIWDEVRKVFASTLEARSQGWSAGQFSYNAGTGRCPICSGAGQLTVEMNFLANAKVICEACNGTRYGDDILSVHYAGKTISQVLQLTFEEAKSVFANHKKIHPQLKLACDLGLGYLQLGQSSPTLSGGEAQRLKIVSELTSAMRGHTLYILDEPTIGLHRTDTSRLLAALRALVDRGASVIVIEHDLDTIASSDYFIEMGPGAGHLGGKVIFSGSPSICADSNTSWGKILRTSVPSNQSVCHY